MCTQFKDRAVELLWARGTTVVCGEEQAASCHLMDILESRGCSFQPKAEGVHTNSNLDCFAGLNVTSTRPYASAFAAHIRSMAEDLDERGRSKLSSTALHWAPFLMQEALVSQMEMKSSTL